MRFDLTQQGVMQEYPLTSAWEERWLSPTLEAKPDNCDAGQMWTTWLPDLGPGLLDQTGQMQWGIPG